MNYIREARPRPLTLGIGIALLIIAILLVKCDRKEYSYTVSKKGKQRLDFSPWEPSPLDRVGIDTVDLIYYVDTFYMEADTLVYANSDGTLVRVEPPFTVTRNR